jgi:hypothetical protein
MSWYYSTATGRIFEATGLEKTALDLDIMVQNKSTLPHILFGPFASQTEAQAFAASHPATGLAGAVTGPVNQLGTGLAGLNPVDKVLGAVGPILVRIGEVVAGIVLLAIAANVILKQTTGVNPAGAAKRAAVAAIPK